MHHEHLGAHGYHQVDDEFRVFGDETRIMEQRAGEAVQFHVFHTVEAAVGIVESGQCRGLIE